MTQFIFLRNDYKVAKIVTTDLESACAWFKENYPNRTYDSVEYFDPYLVRVKKTL